MFVLKMARGMTDFTYLVSLICTVHYLDSGVRRSGTSPLRSSDLFMTVW